MIPTNFKVSRSNVKDTVAFYAKTVLDQSVYQKYGPNLQKIATEMKPFE